MLVGVLGTTLLYCFATVQRITSQYRHTAGVLSRGRLLAGETPTCIEQTIVMSSHDSADDPMLHSKVLLIIVLCQAQIYKGRTCSV